MAQPFTSTVDVEGRFAMAPVNQLGGRLADVDSFTAVLY